MRTGADCLHDAKGSTLLYSYLTAAMTVGTGFHSRTLFSAGAAAVGADFQTLDGDGLLAALDRFHKGQRNGDLHIGALDGGIGVPGTGTSAEPAESAASEEALEDVADVVKAEALGGTTGTAIAAGSCRVTRVYTGKAELIIPAALFRVGKHLVCFSGLLELGLGLLVPRVEIRVILLGQGAICLLYFIIGGLTRYAKHLIVISFLSQTRTPPSRLQTISCAVWYCLRFRLCRRISRLLL